MIGLRYGVCARFVGDQGFAVHRGVLRRCGCLPLHRQLRAGMPGLRQLRGDDADEVAPDNDVGDSGYLQCGGGVNVAQLGAAPVNAIEVQGGRAHSDAMQNGSGRRR